MWTHLRFGQRVVNDHRILAGVGLLKLIALAGRIDEAAVFPEAQRDGRVRQRRPCRAVVVQLAGPVADAVHQCLDREPALGLSIDWDAAVDDEIAEITGAKFNALHMLNVGAKVASIGLQHALSLAKDLLPGPGLAESFKAVQVVKDGGSRCW